jgi:hypothetical protein
MTDSEAIERAWFVLSVGLFLLAGTAAQLLTGYTLIKRMGFVSRKKDPKTYWFGVITWGALTAFCIGLALTGILYPSLLPRGHS